MNKNQNMGFKVSIDVSTELSQYMGDIWELDRQLSKTVKTSNREASPLKALSELQGKEKSTLWYISSFGQLSLVHYTPEGKAQFIGFIKDKQTQKAVTSKTDEYEIHQVKASRRFDSSTVKGFKGEPFIIEEGQVSLRAYAQ